MTERTITSLEITNAILNWQNAIGTEYNGQLEAFLGMTLGSLDLLRTPLGVTYFLSEKTTDRVNKLLSENHPTIIKMWMARNEP